MNESLTRSADLAATRALPLEEGEFEMTPGPEELSAALRGLAREAWRLTMREDATRAEAAELCRQIAQLRRGARPGRSAPLRRWLDALERLVEGHARPEDYPSGPPVMPQGPRACGLISLRATGGRNIEDRAM